MNLVSLGIQRAFPNTPNIARVLGLRAERNVGGQDCCRVIQALESDGGRARAETPLALQKISILSQLPTKGDLLELPFEFESGIAAGYRTGRELFLPSIKEVQLCGIALVGQTPN